MVYEEESSPKNKVLLSISSHLGCGMIATSSVDGGCLESLKGNVIDDEVVEVLPGESGKCTFVPLSEL